MTHEHQNTHRLLLTWKSIPTWLRAIFTVKVEASWWGLNEGCSSGLYLTTNAKSNWACKERQDTHTQMQKRSCSIHEQERGEADRGKAQLPCIVTAARVSPFRCVFSSSICETSLIYLIINVFAVESYVNSKSRRIMMRGEQGLLVRLVPHYKVQVGGTLMRKKTWVKQISQNLCF